MGSVYGMTNDELYIVDIRLPVILAVHCASMQMKRLGTARVTVHGFPIPGKSSRSCHAKAAYHA